MSKRRVVTLIFVLVTALLSVTAVWAQSQVNCWKVSMSRAVNDFGSQTGWCEGYWYYDCTYCWNAAGNGGTCSTNLIYPCNPPVEEHQN